MASGTAVLLSKEVALSKLVTDHQLGWVVELQIANIKSKLEHALSDIDTTRERGEAAHDYVEHHFQWSHVVQQLIRHYKSIT
jgi:glycosyltransferase involved in cell wall biosynthesis